MAYHEDHIWGDNGCVVKSEIAAVTFMEVAAGIEFTFTLKSGEKVILLDKGNDDNVMHQVTCLRL